jgi:hypothetical protein
MVTPSRIERLRQAVADAARKLALQPQRPAIQPSGPVPGDLYVFGTASDPGLEWLVVRSHPDDPDLALLAPADDFPLAGLADVTLPTELAGRPLTVRCGEAAWLPAAACPEHLRTGMVPDEAVRLVRQKLAALARGAQSAESSSTPADADPEYTAWLELVSRTREAVRLRADTHPAGEGTVLRLEQFSPTPPADLAPEPQLALAAKSGDPLLTALGQTMAEGGPRFQEVPVATGGKLLLAADASGVRVAWTGPAGTTPPPLVAFGPSGRLNVNWRLGTQALVHRGEPFLGWVDGQVILTVGSEFLTVRR